MLKNKVLQRVRRGQLAASPGRAAARAISSIKKAVEPCVKSASSY